MESRLGDWTNPAPPPKARHKAIGIMRQRPLPSLKEMLLLASLLVCYRPLSPPRKRARRSHCCAAGLPELPVA